MSISERINPDNLNIHQFQEVPETERPDLPFDVDRDLPGLKEKVLNIISNYIDSPTAQSLYISTARNFLLLWPNEAQPGSNLSRERLEDMKDLLMSNPKSTEDYDLACLKIAHPVLELKATVFDLKRISPTTDVSKMLAILTQAASLKILSPDFDISNEEMEIAKNVIEQFRKSDDLPAFFKSAADLRLLDPSYKPELMDEEWGRLKKWVSNLSVSNLLWCLEFATAMKILAAHSVKITTPGVIDIQMYPPEDLNQSTPPIPEQRKF